jgi:hypothetical protein
MGEAIAISFPDLCRAIDGAKEAGHKATSAILGASLFGDEYVDWSFQGSDWFTVRNRAIGRVLQYGRKNKFLSYTRSDGWSITELGRAKPGPPAG